MKKHPLTELAPDGVYIAPSILAADFCELGNEIRRAEAAGADVLHVDVMDGHFVPNLSIGPPVITKIRGVSELPYDVHLMLTNPERYVQAFAEAGADNITIHVEIEADVRATLAQVHARGCSAGLSLRPATSPETLRPYLEDIDLILVMTVEPGFGGQEFQAEMLPKIREIRRLLNQVSRPIHLEVDGGLNAATGGGVLDAGGNMLVAGTSVFRAPEGMRQAIAALRRRP